MISRRIIPGLIMVLSCLRAFAALEIGQEHSGVMNIAVGNRLERYDLAAQQWLSPLAFPEQIKALHIDSSGIYASFGRRVARYDHSGSNETHVANAPYDVAGIHSSGAFLYLLYPSYPYGNFQSLNKQTFVAVTNVQQVYDPFVGSSYSPQLQKIFGRDSGSSPGDITSIALKPDGTFGEFRESPYHGTYPEGDRTWVFPDGARVVDNSGTVYNGSDLTYNGSLAGAIDDITFYGESPIVLRTGSLLGFTRSLLPTGRTAAGLPAASRVVSHGTNLFVFGPSAASNGVSVAIVPVSRLEPEAPGTPVDPRGLAYTPDSVFMDRSLVLHLFSKNNQSIFRWDTRARAYTNTIPLVGTPGHVAYSPVNHAIYLAYASGQIDQIALSSNLQQRPFVNSPQEPIGLATAGEFVFVCDRAAPWVTHYTYSPSGAFLSSKDWNYFSREYIWNAATRRMFFFRDGSPSDLHTEEIDVNGRIGAQADTPYHGDFPMLHPIRVNNQGTMVLLGSGDIYSGSNLTRQSSLANQVQDAVWWDNDVISMREIGGVTQLQRWSSPNFAQTATRQIDGTPLSIQRLDTAVVAVVKYLDTPRFHILATNMDVIYSSPVAPLAPTELASTNITSDSVTLTWKDNSDNESGFAVFMMDTSTNVWREIATVPPDTATYTATNLAYSSFYDFRVRAFNAIAETEYAGPITIKTLPDPRSPIGPPFELGATRVLASEVHLRWRDNATNEQGFRLERLTNGVWITRATTAPGVTNFVDTGLNPNTVYTYRVRAFNDFSDSESSPDLQVRTLLSDSTAPAGFPGALRLVSASHSEVQLAWTEEFPNEDGLVLERSTNFSTFTVVARLPGNTTAFSDSTVLPAQNYYYRFYATNQFGRSPDSMTLQVTTPPLGGTYLGLSGQQTNVVYFAFDGPPRLERFDLAQLNWRPALPLPDKPTAMHVAADGIYLAFGRKLSRFDFNGQNERFLVNLESDVRVLFD